jgi:hypothetical protein
VFDMAISTLDATDAEPPRRETSPPAPPDPSETIFACDFLWDSSWYTFCTLRSPAIMINGFGGVEDRARGSDGKGALIGSSLIRMPIDDVADEWDRSCLRSLLVAAATREVSDCFVHSCEKKKPR